MIFNPIENMLDTCNSSDNALNKKLPSKEEYCSGKVAVPDHLILKINEILQNSFYCVLLGEKDSGKTWLISLFYYSKIYDPNDESLRKIKMFNKIISKVIKSDKMNNVEFYYKKVDKDFNGDNAWDEIRNSYIGKKLDKKRYIILDDCHFNNKEANTFFDACVSRMKDESNNSDKLKFIFLSRNDYFMEPDECPSVLKKNSLNNNNIYNIVANSRLSDNKTFFKLIIHKFIGKNHNEYLKRPELDEEIDLLYANLKNNLYLLTVWLHVWETNPQLKLSEINLENVYDVLWMQSKLLSAGVKLILPDRRTALLNLSLFCVFEEVFVWEYFIISHEKHQIYLELFEKDGLIHYSQFSSKNYYYIDSDFAQLIINTVLLMDSYYGNDITKMSSTCRGIFKDYLLFEPPVPNADYVFTSILNAHLKTNAEDNYMYAKDLFLLINEDPLIKIKLIEYYVSLDLNRFSVEIKRFAEIIAKLEFNADTQTLFQLKSNRSKIIEEYGKTNKASMISEVRASNGSTLVDKLHKMVIFPDLKSFLQEITVDDYRNVINSGTYTDIYRLFRYFIQIDTYRDYLDNELIKLLDAIDRNRLSHLILSDALSLHRINGVIHETMNNTSHINLFNHSHQSPVLTSCNSFIIECIKILIEDDNLNVVCKNIENIRKNHLINDPSFISTDVSTIFDLNEIIFWLRNYNDNSDISNLLNNFINKSLELDWNQLIYHNDNPNENENRIKSLNSFITQILSTKEQRDNLCNNICDETILNLISDSAISFEVRFYLLWHIHLYCKKFDFSKIDKMYESNNNFDHNLMPKCLTFAAIGIDYIHNKSQLKPIDEDRYFDKLKKCLNILRSKRQTTKLILAIISGRSFLGEEKFLELINDFSNINTLLDTIQISFTDQKEELIKLKAEFISK